MNKPCTKEQGTVPQSDWIERVITAMLKEGRVEDKDEDEQADESRARELRQGAEQEVLLANGVKMAAYLVLPVWHGLLVMQEREPEHLQALIALVQGRPADVSPPLLADLRKAGCVHKDGNVAPDLAAVLAAATRDEGGPDQPLLRYPIVHASREEAVELQKYQDQSARRAIRALRSREGNGDDKGRSV